MPADLECPQGVEADDAGGERVDVGEAFRERTP
jgi:hypothetical protein